MSNEPKDRRVETLVKNLGRAGLQVHRAYRPAQGGMPKTAKLSVRRMEPRPDTSSPYTWIGLPRHELNVFIEYEQASGDCFGDLEQQIKEQLLYE